MTDTWPGVLPGDRPEVATLVSFLTAKGPDGMAEDLQRPRRAMGPGSGLRVIRRNGGDRNSWPDPADPHVLSPAEAGQ